MSQPPLFQSAGRTVANRLFWIHALEWLNRSVWMVAAVTLLALVGLRAAGIHLNEWVLFVGVLAVWVGAILMVQKLRQPSTFQALAAWDEAAQGKSVLSSAEFFERLPERSPGEELHLERASRLLAERRSHLKRDLPIPALTWAWLTLLVTAGFAFTPLLKQPVAMEDLVMTESMQERAKAEAERLAQRQQSLENLNSLSEAEQEEAKALAEMVDETGQMLSESGDKSARELLEALEARARAAEKMAEKLASAEDAWASEAMLEEMARHADTTDLAAAIQDKKGNQSARESEKLAQKLDDSNLTTEVRERMDAALARTMEKATEEDKERPVGEHVGNASKKLAQNQPRPAAQDFRNLAKFFQEMEQRKRAQEDLKKLADQLREAGNNIAQSQLQPMQQLGGDQQQPPPQGAQNLAQAPVPQNQMPQVPNNQGMQQMPVPGQNPAMQQMQAPIPGMPQPPGQQPNQNNMMMGMGAPNQGNQNGQQGGMLMAPVPGQAPGGGQPSVSMMLGGAQSPGSVAGASGLEAGSGTAQMNPNPTEAMNAAKDAVVDAQINEDGESVVRTVQGNVHQESAQRQRQDQVAEFIAVEEEALDEQALPASRRDQVLRYFTALRKQFEKPDE